mmetsp:Transcript_1561/g.1964  ORF Transcript_1561/g.1964 Transcript_1561/m.1964 type:complete len:215 (+) Transcript_1561:1261-1905(+)
MENLVKDMPFFEGEDPSVVMELSFNMDRSFFGPEEEVVRSGDIGDEMYFILEGTVEVLVDTRDSLQPKSVATLTKGDFFGEMALLEPNHVRVATVKTITFCELRCLTAEFFKLLSFSYPQFGRSLKAIVGARKKQHIAAGGRGVNRPMTRSSSFNLSREEAPSIVVRETPKRSFNKPPPADDSSFLLKSIMSAVREIKDDQTETTKRLNAMGRD